MNPYAPTVSSSHRPVRVADKPKQGFRWQVIPATLTSFAALIPLGLAVAFVLSWIEYRYSDRYDPTSTLYWLVMEASIIPISLLAFVAVSLSAWAWVRSTPSKAIAFLMIGFLILFVGFLIRI